MAPPPVFVSPTDEELATLGLVCAPVGASAEDVAMMSRAALGVCARTGLIVCLAGEPRLAAECSSQTIGQGVKGSKISNRIIKTCRLDVKTADVISAESIANRISAQLGPLVTTTRARYLSATPVSLPLEPLLWAGEPRELYICNTCSSGQSNASRLTAHVKGKHGSDMVSTPPLAGSTSHLDTMLGRSL